MANTSIFMSDGLVDWLSSNVLKIQRVLLKCTNTVSINQANY
ncbi:hypothetical protein MtrunA17_Chr2g0282101 [Medicago truncatula]|uniref:Uncharacterized protein n=1 Tax=Medicago truncatula TaxID=3880 RepID=A0A396J572_MEDTR|nr:hypothetical protein MtrunA17_Chr2g0282101 [Medicago truncatula]